MTLKIAFDVGGVLSKYPDVFRKLMRILSGPYGAEVHVVSDMHPVEKIKDMLDRNGFYLPVDHIHSADWKAHGENCKRVLCEKLGIDILVDDFIGYVAGGDYVRLLVMPDPEKSYYADDWETDGSEGDFGRRMTRKNKQG